MKKLDTNFNIFFFDSISKFNIYDKKNLLKIRKLKIFLKLKTIDSLFLKNFLSLSKLFFELFNRKICILKIIGDQNKIKNSIIFYVGFTVNNFFSILNLLNYMLNIIMFSSKKMDDSLNFKKKDNCFLYFFKNINYFIGLNFSKYPK